MHNYTAGMGTQSCGNGNKELLEHRSVETCTELWEWEHRAVGMGTQSCWNTDLWEQAQSCGNENTELWEWEHRTVGMATQELWEHAQSYGNENTELWEWERTSVGTCTELWDHNTDTFPVALTRDGLGTAAASLSEELPEAVAAVGLLVLGGELLSG